MLLCSPKALVWHSPINTAAVVGYSSSSQCHVVMVLVLLVLLQAVLPASQA